MNRLTDEQLAAIPISNEAVKALKLASSRLRRLALKCPHGTMIRTQAQDWADQAYIAASDAIRAKEAQAVIYPYYTVDETGEGHASLQPRQTVPEARHWREAIQAWFGKPSCHVADLDWIENRAAELAAAPEPTE